jgi:hypothetical protein
MIVKTFSCFKLLKAIFIVSPLTLNTSTEAVVTFSSHNFEWFVYLYSVKYFITSELCLNIR